MTRGRVAIGLWMAVGVWAAALLAWQGLAARATPELPVLTPQQAAQGFNVSASPLGLPNLPGTPLGGRPAPPIALTTVSGARMTLKSVAGRVVVLTFVAVGGENGQSSGAGRLLERTRRLLGRRAAGVAMLAVVVDAQVSHAALALWQHQHPGVVLLTGAPGALQAVWGAYGVEVRGQGAAASFTPAVYVLNRRGREETLTVAAPRGLGSQARALVRDIAARLG